MARDEQVRDVLELLRRRVDHRPQRIRRLRGIELVAAEDVLDAVDAHEDGVARVGRVPEARLEMRRDREAVLVCALDEPAEVLRRDALRLEGARALGGPFVDVAIDVLLRGVADSIRDAPCRSTGPSCRCAGRSAHQRRCASARSIMPSGSYSPAGNVDVTPLARKMSGL